MRKCPFCDGLKIACVETRTCNDQTRRRYRCRSCNQTYATIEKYAIDPANKSGKRLKSSQLAENSKALISAKNQIKAISLQINCLLSGLNEAAGPFEKIGGDE